MAPINGETGSEWRGIDPSLRDIRGIVDLSGTIPIETESGTGKQQQQVAPGAPNPDLAGVLRRNQACLQCRRRKLKCDAVRPHCSTCIRSHNHTLRTAPRSGAVLTCSYDDHKEDDIAATSQSPASAEGEGPSGRKKRKLTTGQGANAKSKKKKETEADRLKRKIEALEAELASKSANPTTESASEAQSQRPPIDITRPWAGANISIPEPDIAAESPTAFLDMLSSAATAQPFQPGSTTMPGGGLKSGASGTSMLTGATGIYMQSTGLTPMFTYPDEPTRPDLQHGDSDKTAPHEQSRQSSMSYPGTANVNGNTGPGTRMNSITELTGANSTTSSFPQIPSLDTGNNTNTMYNFIPNPAQASAEAYIPSFDEQGNMKPSGRIDGPWRDIETVDTFVASAANLNMSAGISGLGTQYSTNGAAENMMADLPPMDEAIQQQLLMDLFWPGWPVNLPEPHIVNDLIEAFFELVPNLPRLLHRPRFLARMALPPTHSNFPHPSLIHSICAIATAWCAPALYERSNIARAFDPKTGKEIDFGQRQASLAKEAVHDVLNTGTKMFDGVRAMMILTRIFIDDTRMLECWAYHGLVARMILPLGLNVRSAGLSLKSVMLPPPIDAIEREERRACMWFALYHDTISSAASGWGTSIALDELSIPFPVSLQDFEIGSENMESNPQDLDSPDLYTRHPVPDAFVMVLKASVLLNRVTKFARKWKNRHVKEDDDYEGMSRPQFRELANSIACFQMSFPPELRNPCKMNRKRKLDIDLIAAHLMPHAAIICLYEPFADVTDPSDQAARRLLSAAQAIVGTVQQLAAMVLEGVQNFTTVMHSSTSICLVTSARTCLLFYRHALNIGDKALADSLRSDVEMIRMALAQLGLKFKIGHHHAQLVEYFMDRATNPTYDKMAAHYPEHPRPGAPVLRPDADLGLCVMNALNVKRGYWRVAKGINTGKGGSEGVSPLTSTPGSASAASASASVNNPNHNGNGSGSGSGNINMINQESVAGYPVFPPHQYGFGPPSGQPSRPGSSGASRPLQATNTVPNVNTGPDNNVNFLLPNIASNWSGTDVKFAPMEYIYKRRADGTKDVFGMERVPDELHGRSGVREEINTAATTVGAGASAGAGVGIGTNTGNSNNGVSMSATSDTSRNPDLNSSMGSRSNPLANPNSNLDFQGAPPYGLA